MHFPTLRRLGHASLVIWVWIAVVQAPAARSENTAATRAEKAEPATLKVVLGDPPAEQAADGATAPADEASKQPDVAADAASGAAAEAPPSGQPTPVATQALEQPVDLAADGSNRPAAHYEHQFQEPAAAAGVSEGSGSPVGRPGDDVSERVRGPLQPVPDPLSSGEVPVGTASFNGVTPGVTTVEEIQKVWGPPKDVANRNAQLVHLYAVEPFQRVEVTFVQDRVEAIVIRLDHAFPANRVAEQLELGSIQPVLVSNELGEVLGQSFPERGVLFAFEPSDQPGKPSMKVVQIILEPVGPEPFVLRAETFMDGRPEASLRDLDEAVKLDPKHARAHWLKARLLASAADLQNALEASQEAIRLKSQDPHYRLTQAQILAQLGRFAEASRDAEQALAESTQRPHIAARALCLLGDLISASSQPDYQRALQYHMQAIKTADPLVADPHPALRLAAKEALIDAHLGAAHDIAWGPWDQKEEAVPRWLDRAAALAEDLVENEGGPVEHQFRVATRALAACVGLRGRLDPSRWTEEALRTAQQLVSSAPESPQTPQVRRQLAVALYDAVQTYQMRGERQKALQYGRQAAQYLQPDGEAKHADSSQSYLLGRLYFRLGAIHSIGEKNHQAAVEWFEKAVPIFEASIPQLPQAELGRLGETFVSMGVSYWEFGNRDKALRLTQRGAELMHQAVTIGALHRSALEVPYNNLATMCRHLGRQQQAQQYLQQARRYKGTAVR